MSRAESILTAERLSELLHYNPETGMFTWLVNRWSHGGCRGRLAAAAGTSAGGIDKSTGYMQLSLSVDGQRVRLLLHRVAWLLVKGEWPSDEIDHRNGVRSDNRWDNLRHGTKSMNMENQRRARRDSLTGVQGVQFHRRKGRFLARITVCGRCRVIGYFSTAEEAGRAYLDAKRQLHAGCTI